MKSWITLFITAVMTLLLVACGEHKSVKGTGEISTQERDLPTFDSLEVHGTFKIKIEESDTPKVRVTLDKNLIDYVTTEVDGHVLHIQTEEDSSIIATQIPTVTVGISGLEELKLAGSVDVSALINSDSLLVTSNGSSRIHLSGKVNKLLVELNGSSNLDAKQLEAMNADVKINGSGEVIVNVASKLATEISGSGTLTYYGEPSQIENVTISGSGKVIHGS